MRENTLGIVESVQNIKRGDDIKRMIREISIFKRGNVKAGIIDSIAGCLFPGESYHLLREIDGDHLPDDRSDLDGGNTGTACKVEYPIALVKVFLADGDGLCIGVLIFAEGLSVVFACDLVPELFRFHAVSLIEMSIIGI